MKCVLSVMFLIKNNGIIINSLLMLDFKAILSFSPLVYDAYCEAFPENERRNKKQFFIFI